MMLISSCNRETSIPTFIRLKMTWFGKIAQWVKVLAVKSDSLSSSLCWKELHVASLKLSSDFHIPTPTYKFLYQKR